MPYNPGGIFSLVANYFANPGTTIRTEQHNPPLEDIASALSVVYIRDGRAPMTGPVNMNGFAINNVAAGNTPGSVATLAQSMPIGAVIDYALSTPPAGWLLCFGQALLANTAYPLLRTALINDGSPYGSDGSGNPLLPDVRGRLVGGKDNMGGTQANRMTFANGGINGTSLGGNGGSEYVFIAQPGLPNVSLSFSGVADPVSVTSTTSDISRQSFNFQAQGGGSNVQVVGSSSSIVSNGTFTPRGFVSSINGGVTQQLTRVLSPTIIMNKIIRASYDG